MLWIHLCLFLSQIKKNVNHFTRISPRHKNHFTILNEIDLNNKFFSHDHLGKNFFWQSL